MGWLAMLLKAFNKHRMSSLSLATHVHTVGCMHMYRAITSWSLGITGSRIDQGGEPYVFVGL